MHDRVPSEKLPPEPAATLARYEAARQALAECHRVDEVKSIRDKAVAMQAYAKQAKDTSLITSATEIRMRAERRAGELLCEMEKNKGTRCQLQGDIPVGGNAPKPPTDRTPTLSDLKITKNQSSRWQKLAALDPDRFEQRVERATKTAYDLVARRFIKESELARAQAEHAKVIEHGCTVHNLIELATSGKRFGVIYADPAWPWETWTPTGRTIERHYETMTPDAIAQLPVAPLAAEDCVLLLWCTWPHIAIGTHIKIIEAWGFRPSTAAFDWIKQNPNGEGLHTGLGYYTRSNTEPCLIGIKGKPKRLVKDVNMAVMAPVGEHSRKPEEVRRHIERLFPGPYLELFARKQAPGWTCWGNEIPAPLVAPPPDDGSIPRFQEAAP